MAHLSAGTYTRALHNRSLALCFSKKPRPDARIAADAAGVLGEATVADVVGAILDVPAATDGFGTLSGWQHDVADKQGDSYQASAKLTLLNGPKYACVPVANDVPNHSFGGAPTEAHTTDPI
jgi:hypothetical protein